MIAKLNRAIQKYPCLLICAFFLLKGGEVNAQGRQIEMLFQTPMIFLEQNDFTESFDLENKQASWGIELVYYHKVYDLNPYWSYKRGYYFGRKNVVYSQERKEEDFDFTRAEAPYDLTVIQDINIIEFGLTWGLRWKLSPKVNLGFDLNLMIPPLGKDSRLIYRVEEYSAENGVVSSVVYENDLAQGEDWEEDSQWIQFHGDYDKVGQWFRFGFSIDYSLGNFNLVGKIDYRYIDVKLESQVGATKDGFNFLSHYVTPKIGINYNLTRKY